MKNLTAINPREIRRKLGLNQNEFWSKLGVTQSGGSRYESGRKIPVPTKFLLQLIYVEQIDLSKLKREDIQVANYLRAQQPEQFKALKKQAKAWSKMAN